MADKGIIFSAPMVRALALGRKTQTRRLLTLRGHRKFSEFGPSDTTGYDWHFRRADGCWCDFRSGDLPLPYAAGDRLYVREAFCAHWCSDEALGGQRIRRGLVKQKTGNPIDLSATVEPLSAFYRADVEKPYAHSRWTPAIHMPRWASRLWLEVTSVRIERVQDISSCDAEAEGIAHHPTARGWKHYGNPDLRCAAAETSFETLWDSLHGSAGERWQDNPWIVALSFEVHHGNIDAVGDR